MFFKKLLMLLFLLKLRSFVYLNLTKTAAESSFLLQDLDSELLPLAHVAVSG